ncbi:MAG: META domain-containing protein [Cytophagaceae bacterium]|nr:META domain-containing protein [Cytophagaceae bacterium]
MGVLLQFRNCFEINCLVPLPKPFITFDTANQRVSGSTSCNSFSGALAVDGPKINFTNPMAMTRMMCPGEGEQAFLEMLKKVNRYALGNDNTLTFIIGDIAVMRFVRK